MVMPNFLIIGAAKSGTTSLYRYLMQHPQIFMSPTKEPSFFAIECGTTFQGPWKRWASQYAVTSIDSYLALFSGVSDEVAIGEASTAYLVHPKVPECIHRHIPNVKLIAILRNPVDRAYSDYLMRLLHGDRSHADLIEAIHMRDESVRKNWGLGEEYVEVGFYYTHLRRYFDIFDRSQIRVYLFQDFRTSPLAILQDIFRFLDVEETFTPDLSSQYNVGGYPKNKAWLALLVKLNQIRPRLGFLISLIPTRLRQYIGSNLFSLQKRGLVKAPPLEPHMRRRLIQLYQEDILKLQDLIQQDLSSWLE